MKSESACSVCSSEKSRADVLESRLAEVEKDAERHLARANEEIARRERAEIAYSQAQKENEGHREAFERILRLQVPGVWTANQWMVEALTIAHEQVDGKAEPPASSG